MMEALPRLPDGWVWTSLEEMGSASEQPVLTGPFGTTIGPGDFVPRSNQAVPVVTIGCLRDTGVDLAKAAFVNARKAVELARYRLRSGDVLFSRMASVGRAGFVDELHAGALFNYHLMRLRLRDDALDAHFFIYYVRSSEVVRTYVRSVNHGMTRDGINTEQLLSMPVPLAPRALQDRIVGGIESLLSRLDAAVPSLARARAKLKAYRASVLKAAVEGRLVPTEAELARKEGRAYESAEVLLARILSERRHRWEEDELARMKAARKTPKDDKWKKRYKEPGQPELLAVSALSEGWTWAGISMVGDVQLGRQRAPIHHHGSHMRPYLRVANVFEDRIDTSDVMKMNFSPQDFETYRLAVGDILLNEGQSPHLIGRPAMYRGEVPGACFQNTLIRFKAASGVDPRFALVVFRAQLHNRRYMRIAQITTNIAHLGAGRFAEIEFPLPPTDEQRRIADEVERLMSVADAVESSLIHQQARSRRLRESILKWAFEGKLVDQDPADEPAEKLLARIRAERAAAAPAQKTRARARRLKTAS